MVVTGEVNYRGELIFSISIQDKSSHLHEVPAMIDTGFTGFLTLPQVIIDALSLDDAGEQTVTLGDGSAQMLPRYEVTLHWMGEDIVGTALVADSLPLIGLRLLRGCFLTHHAVDGGAVMLYKP